MTICIDSSAGFRGVRSARCKGTLNTDFTYITALCSVNRNRCQLLTLLDVLTSGGADCPVPDTSHLFSFLPFPPLPILFFFAICLFNLHYLGVPLYIPMNVFLSFICIFSSCCLQYASELQELFFRQLSGVYFFISRDKRDPSW